MNALYNLALCPTSCSHSTPKHNTKWKTEVNGTATVAFKGKALSRASSVTGKQRRIVSAASVTELTRVSETKCRQNIPTEKQLVDPFRQGIITEGGVRYRQTVVIRSYEVGADKTATLESILNLLQETALNHVWVSGLLGDGFGATHGMARNNLIWVVTRMQVQVDEYPIWGEVMEVDTWVGASGKNGMRRDWLIRSDVTGEVLVRATSTWVMMNQQTRRLSKMPEVVRAEISPWFIENKAFEEEIPEKIYKLDTNAKFTNSNLKPKRSDLDMNHHVNNVKYVNWMLETIPHKFLENYQLTRMTLEYRRECSSSDVVESLCKPEEESFEERHQDRNVDNGDSLASVLFQDGKHSKSFKAYTHLLQITGDKESEEIVRGRTIWRRKL
ncbi:palmitoyl-acyl carrier protein thioesterase, chloroplastic-like [Populus nigra]|uniref:palmitoyl-acyl carrier protein thioesterase, chloroplastic-like n=1 Tax=Populus nigra TaxID=3691 RepID=UPI002B277129|nr:palmitoyl-acyl carrier protein thioesterase, chloroplastic-like [Populus nigra]